MHIARMAPFFAVAAMGVLGEPAALSRLSGYAPPPGIVLTLSSGAQGATPAVSINGVNLGTVNMTPWAVTIDGAGVRVTVVDRSPTRLVVRLDIACDAPIGRRNISVMPLGTTLAKFTAPFGIVRALPPALTSLMTTSLPPNTVQSGVTVSGVLTGANLICATPRIPGQRPGESVGTPGSTATRMPLTLTMMGTQAAEMRSLAVDAGGPTATLPVTVTNPPEVSNVTPAVIAPQSDPWFTITGRYLDGVTDRNIRVAGAEVSPPFQVRQGPPGPTGVSSLQVSVASIGPLARGPHSFTLPALGGTTSASFIVWPAPTVASVTPGTVGQGRSTVTLDGTDLLRSNGGVPDVTLSNAEADESVSVQSSGATSTRLVLTVTVSAIGPRTLTVATDSGSATAMFDVPPGPITVEASVGPGRICIERGVPMDIVTHVPLGWSYGQPVHMLWTRMLLDSQQIDAAAVGAPPTNPAGDYRSSGINLSMPSQLAEGQHTFRVEVVEGQGPETAASPLASVDLSVGLEYCAPQILNFTASRISAQSGIFETATRGQTLTVGPRETLTVGFELRGDVYGWDMTAQGSPQFGVGGAQRLQGVRIVYLSHADLAFFASINSFPSFWNGWVSHPGNLFDLLAGVYNADGTVYSSDGVSPTLFRGPTILVQ